MTSRLGAWKPAVLGIVSVIAFLILLIQTASRAAETAPAPPPQTGGDWSNFLNGISRAYGNTNSNLKSKATMAYDIAKSNAIESCKPYFPVVPITGRHQFNILTPEQEAQFGERTLQDAKRTRVLTTNAAFLNRVRWVAERVTPAAQRPDYKWEFIVVETNEVNAACAPGGKIIVNTGLLSFLASKDELAFVVSHEVAHAIARHAGETISRQIIERRGMAGLSLLLEFAKESGRIKPESATNIFNYARMPLDLCFNLPHNREQETEADYIGLLLTARAGYDPAAAIAYFTRHQAAGAQADSALYKYFSTHPVDADRIRNLKQWLPEAAEEGKKQHSREQRKPSEPKTTQ